MGQRAIFSLAVRAIGLWSLAVALCWLTTPWLRWLVAFVRSGQSFRDHPWSWVPNSAPLGAWVFLYTGVCLITLHRPVVRVVFRQPRSATAASARKAMRLPVRAIMRYAWRGAALYLLVIGFGTFIDTVVWIYVEYTYSLTHAHFEPIWKVAFQQGILKYPVLILFIIAMWILPFLAKTRKKPLSGETLMTPRQLFRLMLRIVGLLLFAELLPGIVSDLVSRVGYNYIRARAGYIPSIDFLLPIGAQLFQLAIACYLMFGPRWLAYLLVREKPGMCYECGYSLTGLPASGKCPECGVSYIMQVEPATPPQSADENPTDHVVNT